MKNSLLILCIYDVLFCQAPSAIRSPAMIGKATPASQVANPVFPDPQIVKLDNGGYMAELEINDLPARCLFYIYSL